MVVTRFQRILSLVSTRLAEERSRALESRRQLHSMREERERLERLVQEREAHLIRLRVVSAGLQERADELSLITGRLTATATAPASKGS